MPPSMSPLPSWAAMQEPPPSSDEDLVPNDPALFSTQRKRKKTKTTSQPTSKRPRTTENSNISSNRTANAVAGPSRRRSTSPSSRAGAGSNGRSSGPQAASGSKVKTSRYSMSQSAGKPAESVSTARTKPVRRTREEKQRRRSSVSSDEMPPPVPTLAPRKPNASFPSASAPQARNGTFDRDKMRQRYQSGGSSNASSSREPKSAPVKKKGKVERADTNAIEIVSTPEPVKPGAVINSGEIVEISDSESESEKLKKENKKIKERSAARKAQKRKEAPPAPPAPQDVVEIIDSDDESPAPVVKVQKNEEPSAKLPKDQSSGVPSRPSLPENEMDLGADDNMYFGGEDLSFPDQSTGPADLSAMSVDSPPGPLPPSGEIEAPKVATDSSPADRRSQSPQQKANDSSTASPDAAIHVQSVPASSTIPDGGPADKRLPPGDSVASPSPLLQDQNESAPIQVVGRTEQDGKTRTSVPSDVESQGSGVSAGKPSASPRGESPSAPHSLANGLLSTDSSDADVSPHNAKPTTDPVEQDDDNLVVPSSQSQWLLPMEPEPVQQEDDGIVPSSQSQWLLPMEGAVVSSPEIDPDHEIIPSSQSHPETELTPRSGYKPPRRASLQSSLPGPHPQVLPLPASPSPLPQPEPRPVSTLREAEAVQNNPVPSTSSSGQPPQPASPDKSNIAVLSAPVPSTSSGRLSPPQPASASPYKHIWDSASRAPAAALQRGLGLPVKGKGEKGKAPARPIPLPRLDLSTLQRPSRRLLKKPKTPPRSSVSYPDPVPTPEPHLRPAQSTSSLPRATPLPPLPSQAKRPTSAASNARPWSQKSLADAIMATGQHNAELSSALSHPPRPLSRQRVSSSLQQQTPTPLPLPPMAPALLPPAASAPLPQPPQLVKQEEAPVSLGPSASLIHDIIDLTLSDEEPEAAAATQVQVQAPQASSGQATATTPSTAVRTPVSRTPSIHDVRQMKAKRMRKMLGALQGRSVSSGAAAAAVTSTSQHRAASAAAVTTDSQSGMDVDDTAGAALTETPSVDKSPTDDLRRSPKLTLNGTPSPNPLSGPISSLAPARDDGTTQMEVDSGGEAPLPLEPPSVPEANASPAVVESVAASSEEGDQGSAPEEDPPSSTVPTHHHQSAAPTHERRSYDDEEVYDLEYIGPSAPIAPTVADPEEEAAVEELVAPISASNSPPQEDMNAASEPAPDVSSSSTSSERDFVEPDDESSAVSGSPKPPLRRSSRRSSSSVSIDPLDFLSNDRENASISRGISPDDIPDDSLSLSPRSDHFFDTIDDASLTTTATQYPIITWRSYKQDLKNFQPTVYYAKDLVSKLHDYIHSFDPSFRMLPHMRHVFESAIRENTADDEPDAPWIEIINDVDDEPAPPWEFYYSNKLWVGEGIDPSDMSKLVGCDCIGRCDPKSKTCSCLLRQKEYSTGYFDNGFAYDNKGRVKTHGVPIFECNSLCACDNDECKNRVVQHGRQCHIAIKKTADKGWGVFATRKIPKGTFIGVYAGEYLRDDVCERRGLVYDKSGRTYLLNNDWYYLQGLDNDEEIEYTVDAYHAGNFTRFLNHSCDPNCKVSPFYIDEPDIMKSTIALFSSRDVPAGEELCFAYDGYDPDNPDDDEAILKGSESITKNKCFCGAARCRGYMFG